MGFILLFNKTCSSNINDTAVFITQLEREKTWWVSSVLETRYHWGALAPHSEEPRNV